MNISKNTLEHPVLTLIFFVLLGIMGLFTLNDVAISLMPDIDNPYLTVRTSYTNAGPESVEKTVTKVLEAQLISVSGLKNLTSTSSEGSSRISLEFNYGTDLDIATNNVRDKIDRVLKRLPDDADSPTIMKMDSDSMPIMRIAVRGNRSRDELKVLAEDTIVSLLEQTDGVAEATVSGGRDKIVRVDISQNRLAAYGLTLSTVNSALSKQNLELGGGKITEGKTDYSIRTVGEFASLEEINDTIITKKGDYVVRLSDIGTAYMGYKDKTNDVYINGEPGVYVSVTKQSGKNSVTVANRVYEKMDEIQELLPTDVSMEIISDTTDSIRDTINTLLDSCYQGLLLAVLVLFLFLKNFKSTIIIAISTALTTNIIPHVTSSYTKNDKEGVIKGINQALSTMLIITLPMSVILLFLSNEAYTVFYGSSQYGSVILKMSAMVHLIFGTWSVLNSSLQSMRKFKVIYLNACVGLLINALLDIPMILLFSSIGLPAYIATMFSTCIGYTLSISIVLVYLEQEMNFNYHQTASVIKRLILPCLAVAAFLFVSKHFITIEYTRLTSLISIAINGMISAVIYLVIVYKNKALEDALGKDFLESIFRKLKLKRNQESK